MDTSGLNEAKKLEYIDPVRLLADPGVIAQAVQRFTVEMSKNDREKFTEEMLQAAAWCAGMVQLWRREVRFSPGERAGSDATLAIADAAGMLVGRLQLKQLPDESRSSVGLQDLIDKAAAKRYADPERLYLAFAVNRPGEIDLGALNVEALCGQVAEVWIFGRLAEDRRRWFFYGNALEDPGRYDVTIEDILPPG